VQCPAFFGQKIGQGRCMRLWMFVDFKPADLFMLVVNDFCAQGIGNELRTQTYPDNNFTFAYGCFYRLFLFL